MDYKYSKEELGKDGTINPNYYKDGNPNSHKMLLSHIKDIDTPEQYIGYIKSTILKYDGRFDKKGCPIEDLKKIITYSKFAIKFYKEQGDK